MRLTRRFARPLAAAAALGLAGAGLAGGPAGAADGDPFVSEIHYDNAGADSGEAIEIEAPAGADLTGWQVVLYNGNGGGTYGTTTLSGVVPDSGVVVQQYPVDGLQNGSPDGIALVDAGGEVVEFLSYEGALTATNGPAAGTTSTDIGVSEANTTPAGQSLQKVDGAWAAPATATFGARNGGGGPGGPGEPGEDTHTIAQIQGDAAASPLAGTTVTTTGVVTAAYPTGGFNGYYLQTEGTGGDPDLDQRTASDAVFVFSAATVGQVAVGDHVQVIGVVKEFNGLTEIEVAAGGAVVLDEPAEAVKPVPFALPRDEQRREVFEGMLVAPSEGYAVSDTFGLGGWGTSAFGSIGLGLGGPLVQETDVAEPGTPEYDAAVADNATRAVTLDDGQSARTPTSAQVPYLSAGTPVRTGATLTFVDGVIFDYRFQWNFQPTHPVNGAASDVVTFEGGNTRGANQAPREVGGDVKLATFNVLNYFTTLGVDLPGCTAFTDREGNPISVSGGCDARGAWDAENLARQQGKIVAAINGLGADVVSLEEIENSAKFGTDRDAALASLVEALNAAAGAGTWAFAPSPATLPALDEEDVIRTAFIYKPATVELTGESVVLTDSPAFANAREPLAQQFTAVDSGYSFIAVANHFKSKGGECGDPAPPEGCFDADRVAQAEAVLAFAATLTADTGTDDVFLLGDFNAYGQEAPMQVFYDAGYTSIDREMAQESTYVFDGKVGSLDHVLASPSITAANRVTGADVWGINSVESVLNEYSRYNYFASELFEADVPFRSSDHDPILVGIDAGQSGPGPVEIDVLGTNDFHGRLQADGQAAGAAVLAGAVDQLRAENPNTVFAAAGDLIGASTFTSFIQQDNPTIDALNEAGLDVSAVGNHEFDQGYTDLMDRVVPRASWEYIGANVKVKDEHAGDFDELAESWITEVGGVQIGFVGAVTEHLPELVTPSGIAMLDVLDPITEANRVADEMKASGAADIVVLLVHEGATTTAIDSATDPNSDFGKIVNGASDTIDAIISGHTHLAYDHRIPVEGWAGRPVTERPVVSAGQYGYNLNQISFTYDPQAAQVTGVESEIVPLATQDASGAWLPNFPADPEVTQIVADAVKVADELGAEKLGDIDADVNRARQSNGSENRGGESTLGNLVADVQLWAAQRTDPDAQIAFMNPGGLRANLAYASSGAAWDADGNVAYAEAAAVQPFANTLVTLTLTGDQLEQVLDQQWQPAGASRPFLKLGVSDSFTYTYDPTAAAGERITSMTLDGEPVDPAGEYRVVVNSFLASGGDNFTTLNEGTGKRDTGQIDLEAFVDYMGEFTPVAPDLGQRAVGVSPVSEQPEDGYLPGDDVSLNLSSLVFSAGEPKDGTVAVTLAGQPVGEFAVDPAIVDTTDEAGRAAVAFTVPEGIAAGEQPLVVTGATTGTTVTLPITIGEDQPQGPSCHDLPATIVGGDGADVLTGTKGVDVIAGLGGNDVILGLGGDDVICGGDGNDVVAGGAGADLLDGEAGDDVLTGGPGDDTIIGGPGRDLILAGSGRDAVSQD
ncbi:MAG TPA: ExeM/NucH family extracellular endonuclease [Jiangellaceae bacterium]